jgi:hypothetical protein
MHFKFGVDSFIWAESFGEDRKSDLFEPLVILQNFANNNPAVPQTL